MNKNFLSFEIKVNSHPVRIKKINGEDYISLTDIAMYKNENEPSDVIKKWLSNYDTIEFIGIWEELNNKEFNSAEFRRIKNEAANKSFVMTPSKWCTSVKAKGITSSRGKYSEGVFAASDIALEFASWIDNLFKLYLISEYKRLKMNETYQNNLNWHISRLLTKTNYLLHTDAVKNYIVPTLTNKQIKYIYAEEADLINVALFGITAKEWRINNPSLSKEGNIRDFTDTIHLIILSNLEAINSELIRKNIPQSKRLITLNEIARNQMNTFINNRLKINEKNQLLSK